jgi:hypothetical protein
MIFWKELCTSICMYVLSPSYGYWFIINLVFLTEFVNKAIQKRGTTYLSWGIVKVLHLIWDYIFSCICRDTDEISKI